MPEAETKTKAEVQTKAKKETHLFFSAEIFGFRILKEMKRRKFSCRHLALSIGVSPATINRVTRGGEPSVENYLRLCAWLDESRMLPSALEGMRRTHG